MLVLTPDDHARVTAAVTQAERSSDGEIVTVVAARSDKYHDAALHWAALTALAAMALLALFPRVLLSVVDPALGGWREEAGPGEIVAAVTVLAALAFLLASAILRAPALRLALTPPATKTRRVRARAVDLFRAGTERRTRGRTGVLIYLSLAERRAEIVADAAIHAKVAPDIWGEAMAALLGHVRAGRVGEGLEAAVAQVGAVLAEHFPRTAGDTDELPDRVIEL
jgi:putative membrane protein